MDEEQLRADLEYQILSDYLLTNTDRHMENIGVLRDADSLKWIRMAPIFDTGKAFAAGGVVPYTEEEIDAVEVNSFEPTEQKLLGLVRDKSRIDMSKLLSPDAIRKKYETDSKMHPGRIDHIVRLYEKKIEKIEKK